MKRIVVKETSRTRMNLMPGTLLVEEVPVSEQKSKGGIILAQHDPERKFDRLCYGIVLACGAQYRDLHGLVCAHDAVDAWPIPEGALVCFKKHQIWLPPEHGDRQVVINGFDVTQWWGPGDFTVEEESE